MVKNGAVVVTTMLEVEALNELYGRDVRAEEVNGTIALFQGTTGTHIGTLAGEALGMLQTGADSDAADEDAETAFSQRSGTLCARKGKCVKERCMTLMKCGKGCHVCYMFHCH